MNSDIENSLHSVDHMFKMNINFFNCSCLNKNIDWADHHASPVDSWHANVTLVHCCKFLTRCTI